MNRTHLTLAIIISLGIIALRVIGFVPNMWLMLGFILFAWLWGIILHYVPTRPRLINWVFGVTLTISLVTTVGWNLYHSYVQPNTPMIRAASERAGIATDMETALRLNPHLLKSRIEVTNQLQYLQDKLGEKHAVALQGIRGQLGSGTITPEQAWEQTLAVLAETASYREKSQEAVTTLTGKKNKPAGDSESKVRWFDGKPWFIIGFLALGLFCIFFGIFRRTHRAGLIFFGAILVYTGWLAAAHGWDPCLKKAPETWPRTANAATTKPIATAPQPAAAPTPAPANKWSKARHYNLVIPPLTPKWNSGVAWQSCDQVRIEKDEPRELVQVSGGRDYRLMESVTKVMDFTAALPDGTTSACQAGVPPTAKVAGELRLKNEGKEPLRIKVFILPS